jgi:protein MAK11
MKLEVAIGTYEGFLYGFTLSLPPAGEGGTPAAVQRFGYNVRGGCLKCVALAQDGSKAGKLLVTGGTDEVIRIYDFGKRVVVGELRQHDGTVTGLNFYSSSHMLSCSDDGSICIWRTHDWTLLHILGGHKGAVTGMHVHPTGRMAISVSSDRTLRLWNLLEGRCAFIKRTKGDGQLIEWSPSGAHFAVGIHSDLFIYDAASESAADDGVVRCSHSTRLNSIAWVNDGVLVTASNDNELRFWKTDGSLVASKKLGALIHMKI